MTVSAVDLATIEARANAATPGPWTCREYWFNHDGPPDAHVVVDGKPVEMFRYHDAEFIARAREDIPALVARIEELEREVEDRIKKVDRDDAFVDGRILEAADRLVSGWDDDPDTHLGIFCQELADAVHAKRGVKPHAGGDMLISRQDVRLLLSIVDNSDAVIWGRDQLGIVRPIALAFFRSGPRRET